VEGGTDRKTAIGYATNESRGHSFCFRARGEAFIRENGDLEKSLISYLNN